MAPVAHPRSHAFSLVEVVVAVVVASMAAYMFSTGFSGIHAGLDHARDVDWARRLVATQVLIFQNYATTNPTRTNGRQSGQLPSGEAFPEASVVAAGDYTLKALPEDDSTPRTYDRPNSGDPRALHALNPAAFALDASSPWHVLNLVGGDPNNPKWLKTQEYRFITGMGYNVRVWLADVQVTYNRQGVGITPPSRGGNPWLYYMIEVVVTRNDVYLHSVQMLMG